MIGAAGFVAPRHLKAIHDTGNVLVAATDPNDSVGILDKYFPDAKFFTEIERFDRHLEKLRRQSEEARVKYVSVCSPNYLHDSHVRLALRCQAHAICEKPLVISPWNVDALREIEEETGCRVHTVLQLRLIPSLMKLREEIHAQAAGKKADVVLSYMTKRGAWYDASWKGQLEKSGGVGMNIGIHFFDLMLWLFGPAERSTLHLREGRRMAGTLELARARVRWFLSIDERDLPETVRAQGKSAFRSMTLDGREIEFSEGFGDLHTRVYEEVIAGRGFTLDDARPAIEVVHSLRGMEPIAASGKDAHPLL